MLVMGFGEKVASLVEWVMSTSHRRTHSCGLDHPRYPEVDYQMQRDGVIAHSRHSGSEIAIIVQNNMAQFGTVSGKNLWPDLESIYLKRF